jgi:hypothetical protein
MRRDAIVTANNRRPSLRSQNIRLVRRTGHTSLCTSEVRSGSVRDYPAATHKLISNFNRNDGFGHLAGIRLLDGEGLYGVVPSHLTTILGNYLPLLPRSARSRRSRRLSGRFAQFRVPDGQGLRVESVEGSVSPFYQNLGTIAPCGLSGGNNRRRIAPS